MKSTTRLALGLFIVLMILLPLLFGQLMVASLAKLHLSPTAGLLVMIGIFAGSLVNIPVCRILRDSPAIHDPLKVFGMPDAWPALRRPVKQTIIAVNVGGCLIPAGLAGYEIVHLVIDDPSSVTKIVAACSISILLCYLLASPIPGLGIALPGLVPPLVAAASAMGLAPAYAPPVAFVAGVLGPLIGADLLHLKDIRKMAAGVVSIGGAGTFDGIVLSGIVAAYLA